MDIQKKFEQVTSPQISNVISEALAEIYHNKPLFPITYLAQWLNSYSDSQKTKKQLINTKKSKQQRYEQLQQVKEKTKQTQLKQNQKIKKQLEIQENQFQTQILQTKHLEDLLQEWLPQFIQKSFQLTAAYVGKLDFNKKPIQEGNFQVGAENDTENPKIVTYIGASYSHAKLMIGAVLPTGKGISYGIFEDKSQENVEQGGQQTNVLEKKSYLYITNVLRQQNLHFFKFPKLGSYVCYPIRVKGYLNIPTLDKGIVDYKAFMKGKQEAQKQYNEKIAEARGEVEETLKKFEDFETNEEDPSSQEHKRSLGIEAKLADQKLQQLMKSPPSAEQSQLDTVQRDLFLAGDTLGQDKQISQENLQNINSKIQFFINQWQQKQKKMLLTDILTFLEQEPQLQTIQNLLLQHEKNTISTFEPQIKEQFVNKEKEAEFELSLIKCEKTRQLLNEPNFKASMQIYLNYNVPKFTELIQVWCMLLQHFKQEINLPQSNQLNHRKMINAASFKNLLEMLEKYQLRRQSSEAVSSDYKINKLLQRLEKIQSQTLARYNAFLFVLHSLLKSYCWTRIFCRDAKKELFQTKTRQKEDREHEIQKWQAEIQKNLEATKTALDEESQQSFNEEDWRKTYQLETPKPEHLEAPQFREFLDIE